MPHFPMTGGLQKTLDSPRRPAKDQELTNVREPLLTCNSQDSSSSRPISPSSNTEALVNSASLPFPIRTRPTYPIQLSVFPTISQRHKEQEIHPETETALTEDALDQDIEVDLDRISSQDLRVDHDFVAPCELALSAGLGAFPSRLRTSSLTSEASSQRSAGVDSGNSSRLDGSSSCGSESSSAGSRSRAASIPRSYQNLISCGDVTNISEITSQSFHKGRRGTLTGSSSGGSSEDACLGSVDFYYNTSENSVPVSGLVNDNCATSSDDGICAKEPWMEDDFDVDQEQQQSLQPLFTRTNDPFVFQQEFDRRRFTDMYLDHTCLPGDGLDRSEMSSGRGIEDLVGGCKMSPNERIPLLAQNSDKSGVCAEAGTLMADAARHEHWRPLRRSSSMGTVALRCLSQEKEEKNHDMPMKDYSTPKAARTDDHSNHNHNRSTIENATHFDLQPSAHYPSGSNRKQETQVSQRYTSQPGDTMASNGMKPSEAGEIKPHPTESTFIEFDQETRLDSEPRTQSGYLNEHDNNLQQIQGNPEDVGMNWQPKFGQHRATRDIQNKISNENQLTCQNPFDQSNVPFTSSCQLTSQVPLRQPQLAHHSLPVNLTAGLPDQTLAPNHSTNDNQKPNFYHDLESVLGYGSPLSLTKPTRGSGRALIASKPGGNPALRSSHESPPLQVIVPCYNKNPTVLDMNRMNASRTVGHNPPACVSEAGRYLPFDNNTSSKDRLRSVSAAEELYSNNCNAHKSKTTCQCHPSHHTMEESISCPQSHNPQQSTTSFHQTRRMPHSQGQQNQNLMPTSTSFSVQFSHTEPLMAATDQCPHSSSSSYIVPSHCLDENKANRGAHGNMSTSNMDPDAFVIVDAPENEQGFTRDNQVAYSLKDDGGMYCGPSQGQYQSHTSMSGNVSIKTDTRRSSIFKSRWNNTCRRIRSLRSVLSSTVHRLWPAEDTSLQENELLEETGYRPGMVLSVSRDCFRPVFLEEYEQRPRSCAPGPTASNWSSSSVNSTPNGEEVDEREFVSSNKTMKLGMCRRELRREETRARHVPSYAKLCVFAMLFNLVLGVVAFFLNNRARREYRRHRFSRANILYFFVIILCTTSIFITISVATLLLANGIVEGPAQVERDRIKEKLECQAKYLGQSFDIMNFYGMEEEVFCTFANNEGVMQALMGYMMDVNIMKGMVKTKVECKLTTVEQSGSEASPDHSKSLGIENLNSIGTALENGSSSSIDGNLNSTGGTKKEKGETGDSNTVPTRGDNERLAARGKEDFNSRNEVGSPRNTKHLVPQTHDTVKKSEEAPYVSDSMKQYLNELQKKNSHSGTSDSNIGVQTTNQTNKANTAPEGDGFTEINRTESIKPSLNTSVTLGSDFTATNMNDTNVDEASQLFGEVSANSTQFEKFTSNKTQSISPETPATQGGDNPSWSFLNSTGDTA
ncbi:uncharacterized protein LOC101848638 [Aplysia californica]|uniref:Uncharacterized protein LOC101848638 n=1 Tax=Aplysia californica TaxID=6500 RepID=A0ABM1AEN1_APLCA|nr:uncharacterized protein LOC101848638 [Aplysia californica]